ncbi:MAG: hypothetical protein DLM57_07175 [Pseudonocardiales bacterium]|nr:MAG: hypothetical protein DLM57_07175 [Pseudonocardiales bacterium]
MTTTLPARAPAAPLTLETAPYALVRLAAIPYPAPPPGAAGFRTALAQLTALLRDLDGVRTGLADALHDSAASHPAEFHRSVVLPLRRAVFNGRLPRSAVLDELGDLPERVPALAAWLENMARRAEAEQRVRALTPAALAAERTVLAGLCQDERLRKAVTITGADLLRGIDRTAAAGGDPDARTRKAEPNVLRYALRACAKTSPLSWYTHVAWGSWTGGSSIELATPVAASRPNRLLVAKLVAGLLGDARRRERLPHRAAPTIRELDNQIVFRRDVPVRSTGHVYTTREEQVVLPATGALRFLIATIGEADGRGAVPAELIEALAARLGAGAEQAATSYVRHLIDIGLLVAVEPVEPQTLDVLLDLACWLDGLGEPALAGRLRAIDRPTAEFGDLPAAERPGRIEGLAEQWRALGDVAGVDLTGVAPVNEDSFVRAPVRLDAGSGLDRAGQLAELTPFLAAFDQQLLLRRLARDRFVDRYGAGACTPVADCVDSLVTDWVEVFAVGADGRVADGTVVSAEAQALAAARAELTRIVRASGDPDATDATIPPAAVRAAADLLPGWARARPTSYSFFVQPLHDEAASTLVVNHVYGGFGQFTSRFLSLLDPSALAAVRARVDRTFPGGRTAQLRPVRGFNPNLHPMVAALEIGEDPAWADLAVDSLELWHDPDADQLRLRVRGTDDVLDVLYLGFLVPYVLPERLAPLYSDLSCGMPRIAHLAPSTESDAVVRRGRLRYRDVVLERRSWRLSSERVRALRAEVEAETPGPAVAAARLRASFGVPGQVFLGSGDTMTSREDYERYLNRPKPQYVDLDNALHLRCLPRLLARHHDGMMLTEALPVPGSQRPGGRVTELVVETYWTP